MGPAPSGPKDLGQRIWDLQNHSFEGGRRIGAHGRGAHGYRATDLGSARPLKNRGPSCWHPRIGGPRISGYGFGICTTTHSFGTHGLWPLTGGPRIPGYGLGMCSFAAKSKSVARDPLAPNPWAPPLGPQRMRGFTDPKSVARNPWAPNPFAPTESSGCAASRSVARDPCATNPRAPLE